MTAKNNNKLRALGIAHCPHCGSICNIERSCSTCTTVQDFKCANLAKEKASKNKAWTTEEDELVRHHYPTQTMTKLLAIINRSKGAIYGRAEFLGVSKIEGFSAMTTKKRWEDGKQENSRTSHFPKGHKPANKGKKMSAELRDKIKHTFFIDGHLPHNALEDGAISIRTMRIKDGTTRKYKWIRISKSNWIMYHVHLWQQANGTLPKDHIVVFKNGNSMDVRMENLECISLADNMRRNTIMRWPKDLRQLIKTQTKFHKKTQNYAQK